MLKLPHYFLVLLAIMVSCKEKTQEKTTNNQAENVAIKTLNLRHAKGFSIRYYADYKLVSVLRSGFITKDTLQYILVERGKKQTDNFAKKLPKNAIIVEIPLQSIVCLSTTHAPLLAEINEIDKIVGFSDIKYSAISQLQEQAENGKTKDVAAENGAINTELLLSLQANAMMTYSEKDYHKFTKLGQKVLINTEYLENSPLGRAEWILFAAAFFNKETIAQSFFDKVETSYLDTKNKVAKVTKKPNVFGTIPYSSIWYMPTGESFAGNLWLDAGAEYAWKNTKGAGSLQLSIEEVIEKAQKAQIWLNVGSINSIKELIATDNRFIVFEAVKNKQVYNCNKKITVGGGNEFYEYGVIRPDLVLKDLVNILHPNLLPNEELYFFKKLE